MREQDRIREVFARRDRQEMPHESYFDHGYLFGVQMRERRVLTLLRRAGIKKFDSLRFLEIGCGTGNWLREFVKWGAAPEHVVGIDLQEPRVNEALRRLPGGVSVLCGDAASLSMPDKSFDIILQSTVFTSILDFDLRLRLASEMVRLLSDNGVIIWYDFHIDNPRNPDVRGVRKDEIKVLFPDCVVDMKRITLAPPVARVLAPCSMLLCTVLELCPLLCSHYLGTIRKAESRSRRRMKA